MDSYKLGLGSILILGYYTGSTTVTILVYYKGYLEVHG